VKPHTQISGHLEKCCLLLSANESYERAEQDIEVLTGIRISRSTQQRLVHRHEFPQAIVRERVEELSIDGGKVRLRAPKGKACIWNDYKAVTLHGQATVAYFKENSALVDWVNRQPKAEVFSCLGDGHDGIWNLFSQIGTQKQRYEILDWFHLMENLHKVGGSLKRLKRVEAFLWRGKVDEAVREFNGCKSALTLNFVAYVQKHRQRIPNYEYLNTEGLSIGSGAVESAVKQIGRRVKLSGAQWDSDNVPQVLKHRCAYLNGYFTIPLQRQHTA
jgi:hypothetical protein